jgi:hypothetical protein
MRSPDPRAPLVELLTHLCALAGVGWVIGEVAEFVRISFQIEELFVLEFRPVHVLPVAPDDPLRRRDAVA